MTDDSIYIGGDSPSDLGDETKAGDPSSFGDVRGSFAAAAAPPIDVRDYGSEALVFLLRDLERQGPEPAAFASRLLALHPQATALATVTPQSATFKDLMFDELAALESSLLGVAVDPRLLQREPLAYWLRRREIARHLEMSDLCARLPPVFAVLAKSPDRVVLAGCGELSARMLTGLLLGKPEIDVRAFLRPLQRDTQRRVMELIDATRSNSPAAPRVPPHDAAIADIWLSGIERITNDPARGPRRVGELLGRMLLATLLERVDPALVRRAIDGSVTVIFQKLLESDVFEIDFETAHGPLADDLAVSAFLGNGT